MWSKVLLIRPTILLALLSTTPKCLLNFSVGSKVTPRSFSSSRTSRSFLEPPPSILYVVLNFCLFNTCLELTYFIHQVIIIGVHTSQSMICIVLCVFIQIFSLVSSRLWVVSTITLLAGRFLSTPFCVSILVTSVAVCRSGFSFPLQFWLDSFPLLWFPGILFPLLSFNGILFLTGCCGFSFLLLCLSEFPFPLYSALLFLFSLVGRGFSLPPHCWLRDFIPLIFVSSSLVYIHLSLWLALFFMSLFRYFLLSIVGRGLSLPSHCWLGDFNPLIFVSLI